MLAHIIEAVRRDWEKTCTIAGYVKRRIFEKTTIAALSASLLTANDLKQPYAALSILLAVIISILPSSALTPAGDK